MADVSKTILNKNNFSGDDVDLFIPHQANKRIIDAAAKDVALIQKKLLSTLGIMVIPQLEPYQ